MSRNNYAFIDGQNLDKSIKELGWILDYTKFKVFLDSNFFILKAFYFIGYIPENQKLYKDLRNSGFTLSLRKPVKDTFGNTRANVDSNLITHTLMKIDSYNKAVIVAGDSDYYCLAKYLLRQNKLKQILIPSSSKCPKIFRQYKNFRNYISYLDRQKEVLQK